MLPVEIYDASSVYAAVVVMFSWAF